jgi:hypothetical protein
MKVMLTRFGVAVLGCAAAIMCSAAVASADPPDPHQWMRGNGWVGPTWNYAYVGDSGNNTFPAPPPPGGCNGAIPAEPPAPPAN